jgi:hypothetical protein
LWKTNWQSFTNLLEFSHLSNGGSEQAKDYARNDQIRAHAIALPLLYWEQCWRPVACRRCGKILWITVAMAGAIGGDDV